MPNRRQPVTEPDPRALLDPPSSAGTQSIPVPKYDRAPTEKAEPMTGATGLTKVLINLGAFGIICALLVYLTRSNREDHRADIEAMRAERRESLKHAEETVVGFRSEMSGLRTEIKDSGRETHRLLRQILAEKRAANGKSPTPNLDEGMEP